MIQIDVLPDEVLLGIFDFYEDTVDLSFFNRKPRIEAWQKLVHVCRRWRDLVFWSPRRLNLRLYCTPETPVRDRLDIWPALPLLVNVDMTQTLSSGMDNIIAALGQSNRVSQVNLWGSRLGNVLPLMQVPFPELTDLRLSSRDRDNIPDTFLGGSAPRLRRLELNFISFPGLPKLLLSATHLVELHLRDIPYSGAIVPSLTTLSNLKSLTLNLEHSPPYPDWEIRSLPQPKRSILPALTEFHFDGLIEYLEELVTRIKTPQLDKMYITFYRPTDFDFDCSRLIQFINRTPTLRALDEAHVEFHDLNAILRLRYQTSDVNSHSLPIDISCRNLHRQPSSIEQICNPSLYLLSTVEDLYIELRYFHRVWNDAVGKDQWLELFLPFIAVKNLYLSKEFAPCIAAALQELVGDRITEVLPNLQNIFVKELEPSGPFQENIGQFVAARQLSNHSIAISVTVWHETPT